MLGEAILFAHRPRLEDASGVFAIQTFVVVIVKSGKSVVDVFDFFEGVVKTELSLENTQSVAVRRAFLLGAYLLYTVAIILALFLAFLCLLSARLATRL